MKFQGSRLRICIGTFLILAACSSLAGTAWGGENWPGWRGARGDGSSSESGLPVEWDGTSGKNVEWKVSVPGSGHGSPIIWGNRVFLLTCEKAQRQRSLLCYDIADGRLVWKRPIVTAPLETKHSLNSFASGTPATDGRLVYVSVLEVDGRTVPAPNVGNTRPVTPGQIVVAAYDFSGARKWICRPGGFVSAHGFCSSPVLYGNLVIVNGDHDGDSYIVALDKASGKIVWKVKRKYGIRSYVTPLIREIAGQPQMVVSGSKRVVSYDPRDGSVRWLVEGPTEQFVASMVFDGKNFFLSAGFPTHHVMAISPDGRGDVSESHVTWHVRNAKCYVPSPVVVDGYLIVADDRGTANCFDATTGDRHWQKRIGRHFSASLITAGGLVYCLDDDGLCKVIKPGPELKVVAENKLGEACFASPAFAHGRLFVRAEHHLYSIRN